MTFHDPADPEESVFAELDRDRTLARGRTLRRQRRLAGFGAAAGVVAAMVITVSVAGIDQGHHQLVTVARPEASSVPASFAPTPSLSTSPPVSTTLPTPTTTGASAATSLYNPPTTTPPVPTTKVVPATTTTTVSTTSTTFSPALAQCAGSMFTFTTTTDKSVYGPGQTVTITVKATDRSACEGNLFASCGVPTTDVFDHSGTQVWNDLAELIYDHGQLFCPAQTKEAIEPGWSTTYQVDWTEDQCSADPSGFRDNGGQPDPDCTQAQVPAGVYSITEGSNPPAVVTIS